MLTLKFYIALNLRHLTHAFDTGYNTFATAIRTNCLGILTKRNIIMKQTLSNSKVYLDQDELNMLVEEVKETVVPASNTEKESNNIFSAADLWNIRRKKTRIQRRTTIWN